MNAAEQYRALVNKLEAIDNPTNESEQLDEIVPAVVAGVAGIASAIKGGSDYLNKIAAAKQAVGNLKPEEVKQLADQMTQLEKAMEDPETAKAIAADQKLSARVAELSKKAKELQSQSALASQGTAATIGGTVGAAAKEPFRQVGKAWDAVTGAVGNFASGFAKS